MRPRALWQRASRALGEVVLGLPAKAMTEMLESLAPSVSDKSRSERATEQIIAEGFNPEDISVLVPEGLPAAPRQQRALSRG